MIAVPTAFSEPEKQLMLALVGAATAQMNERSTSADDRRQLQELVGLLSAVVFHEAMLNIMSGLAKRTELLEMQLAQMQRAGAAN
jgi:recombinational DNA repair ATPase RecF